MLVNKLKQAIVNFYFKENILKEIEITKEDIENLENINDVWDEAKIKINNLYITLVEKLEALEEGMSYLNEKLNLHKVLIFDDSDNIIDKHLFESLLIKNNKNVLLLNLNKFIELEIEELQEQLGKLNIFYKVIQIFMREKFINYMYNKIDEKDIKIFILGIFSEKNKNFLNNKGNEEILQKVALASINIPYKKHICLVPKVSYYDDNLIKWEKNFIQYENVLNIFHEFLNSKDPLWKFLLLYHIIENFAFRMPIVEQLKKSKFLTVNSLSFICKFKNEDKIIKQFVKRIIEKTGIEVKIDKSQNENKDIIEAIEYLGEGILRTDEIKTYDTNNFVDLIYKIRNCIVHNKEIEWLHIDHNLLNSDKRFFKLFNEYLLPNLEKIIRYAIFNENDITDYLDEHPNYILLWGEKPIK